jgi:hypothetical protein
MKRAMNHCKDISARILRRDGRRNALQRLDEQLELSTTNSNAEIIRRLRQTMFADVDELEKSGQIILPE